MKNSVTTFVSVAFGFYILTTFAAASMFSHQYAKESSFGTWYFTGEIVPYTQALVWPYYAVTGFSGDNGNVGVIKSSLHHMNNSTRIGQEAVQAMRSSAGTDAEFRARVLKLLDETVAEAELVDDTYLQQVHPELPSRFKKGHTEVFRTFANAYRTDDFSKIYSAANTHDNWMKWKLAHKGEFQNP